MTFLGHAFFLLLTRPNAHNKNFPYHVRTTQVRGNKITDKAVSTFNLFSDRNFGGYGRRRCGERTGEEFNQYILSTALPLKTLFVSIFQGATPGGNGVLSNGNATTLDAFSHGGSYAVNEHSTAMDIFTVDTVGSRRQYAPAVPPPYSAAAAAANSAAGRSGKNCQVVAFAVVVVGHAAPAAEGWCFIC